MRSQIASLLVAAAAVAATAACSTAAPSSTVTATVTQPAATVTVPGPAQTTVTLPAVTRTVTAQPPAPKAAIEEGVWTVGTDIAPGTYRTIEPVTEGCYWSITKAGSNGDIVDNGLPTGGRPTVTLRKGQEFESRDCGSWAKR